MVRALQRIAWSSCAAGLQLVHAPYDQIHQAVDQLHGCVIGGEGDRLVPDADDVAVCREALEVLSVCLALCPDAVDVLYKERVWQTFIIDVLLVCRNRLLTFEAFWALVHQTELTGWLADSNVLFLSVINNNNLNFI